MKRSSLSPMVLFVNGDTFKVFPATAWSEAEDVGFTRDALETMNMPASNGMTIAIGMQTCNTPDAPDAATALGSTRTADGLTFPAARVDRSASTGSKQLLRFGYLAKNTATSDTTLRLAWAAGMVQTEGK